MNRGRGTRNSESPQFDRGGLDMRYLKYAVLLGLFVVVAGAGTAHAQVAVRIMAQATLGRLRYARMVTMAMRPTRARLMATTARIILTAACLLAQGLGSMASTGAATMADGAARWSRFLWRGRGGYYGRGGFGGGGGWHSGGGFRGEPGLPRRRRIQWWRLPRR